MKNVSVARRYAKALYELALEEKTISDVLQGLSNIALAHKESPELVRVLANPLVTAEEKQKIIKSITSNKLIFKLVGLLAQRKRMDLIQLVYELFQQFSDEKDGINRVLIKTPETLSSEQKKLVESSLSKTLGGKIVGRFEIAKELVGGIWIKMGDQVLDASVRGKIDDLRHTLIHSTN